MRAEGSRLEPSGNRDELKARAASLQEIKTNGRLKPRAFEIYHPHQVGLLADHRVKPFDQVLQHESVTCDFSATSIYADIWSPALPSSSRRELDSPTRCLPSRSTLPSSSC